MALPTTTAEIQRRMILKNQQTIMEALLGLVLGQKHESVNALTYDIAKTRAYLQGISK